METSELKRKAVSALCSVTGQPPLPGVLQGFIPGKNDGSDLQRSFLLGKEHKKKRMARNSSRQVGVKRAMVSRKP